MMTAWVELLKPFSAASGAPDEREAWRPLQRGMLEDWGRAWTYKVGFLGYVAFAYADGVLAANPHPDPAAMTARLVTLTAAALAVIAGAWACALASVVFFPETEP